MKTRFYSRVLALGLLFAVGALGLKSCAPELVTPPITTSSFGAIRIMNFAECDQLDAYIYREGSLDTVTVRGVKYGVSSVYTNNLIPGNYNVMLTNTNRKDEMKARSSVNVVAGRQETFVVRLEGSNFSLQNISDFPDRKTLDPTKVYIRFIHTNAGPTKDQAVDIRLNNPLEDPVLSNVQPNAKTDYVTLNHKLDSTYGIYLTAAGTPAIMARLGGAAFSPGQTYTITYAGNPSHCRDTAMASGDTLRIRYFDDNELGNEQTFPVPQSLVFNFINGLLPSDTMRNTDKYSLVRYDSLGIVVNNDDRYTFDGLKPFDPAPVVQTGPGNVLNTVFRAIPWTDAIVVSAYRKDGLTGQQRGLKLAEARVGRRVDAKSDLPFSIILFDTVRGDSVGKTRLLDSSKVLNLIVPLPDEPAPGSAKIVVVNALSTGRRVAGALTTSRYATMFVNGEKTRLFNNAKNAPFYDTTSVVAAGSVRVHATLGQTGLAGPETTFQAEAGGIYEVILMGAREHSKYPPRLVVVRTNPVLNLK